MTDKITKLHCTLGLAGVHSDENSIAVKWGNHFNVILTAVVIWLLVQWCLEVSGEILVESSRYFDILILLFFAIETIILLKLVKNRKRFLKQNWLNVLIVVSGFILLFLNQTPLTAALRALRIILVITLSLTGIKVLFRFLTDNRLDTTLATVLVVLVLSALLISNIDPAISTFSDGLWWAWVTISTVGYGAYYYP